MLLDGKSYDFHVARRKVSAALPDLRNGNSQLWCFVIVVLFHVLLTYGTSDSIVTDTGIGSRGCQRRSGRNGLEEVLDCPILFRHYSQVLVPIYESVGLVNTEVTLA
jgi:hypothetical protein